MYTAFVDRRNRAGNPEGLATQTPATEGLYVSFIGLPCTIRRRQIFELEAFIDRSQKSNVEELDCLPIEYTLEVLEVPEEGEEARPVLSLVNDGYGRLEYKEIKGGNYTIPGLSIDTLVLGSYFLKMEATVPVIGRTGSYMQQFELLEEETQEQSSTDERRNVAYLSSPVEEAG